MIFCLAVAVLTLFLVAPVMANPPSDMTLAYNEQSGELEVTLTHPVADPTTHYIKTIQVSINGQKVNETRFTSQPATTTFFEKFPLTAQPGDEIEVTASCVLGGDLTKQMTIGEEPATAAPTQKAATGMIPFLGLALVLLFKRG
jgi:desulfoferrodoxin (superoxide reductase-like protein)